MQPQVIAQSKGESRDYRCPCGKSYLSYPALFTHIKQKHGGKAPGEIQKPKLPYKQRGRPPLSSKKQASVQIVSKQTDNTLKQSEESKAYKLQYQLMFLYLHQIQVPEYISDSIWQRVNSFQYYENFIDSQQQIQQQPQSPNIGIGLTQFLKEISIKTQHWRFQQSLILFMLLLQYVIDECNSQAIIQEAPLQTLIQYMNPFINQHINDYAQFLGISNLWIMRNENMQKIFLCFYNWIKWKNYTSFCITLI